MPDIALALVTHDRSRFGEEARAQVHGLAQALSSLGLSVAVLVSDRDDYDAARLPITDEVVRRAADGQADLEYRWRRFLTDNGARGRSELSDRAVRWLMRRRRRARLTAHDLVRLVNIDLSHLRAMSEGIDSGAPWTIVLEDDARTRDVDLTARQIVDVIDAATAAGAAMVNLSESLDPDSLGVSGLLGDPVAEVLGCAVVPTRVPITNTVCAVMYHEQALKSLRDRLLASGLDPIVPIDWRVNEVILSDAQVLAPTLWVMPGPFLQGSMHA